MTSLEPRAGLPEWLKRIYPFAPRRFATSAGEMSYLDEGSGTEAVLMVHGNPTWSFFYRNVVLALRDRYRCIVPDHLGCGLSDKPQDYAYTLPNHVANLQALVRSLGLKKVHLIVHDWGGPIGLGTMLPQLEVLHSYVVLNTAAFADTRIPARIRFCRIPGLGRIAVRGFNAFAGPAARMAVVRPLPDDVKRGFLWPYRSWRDRVAVHQFVRDIPTGQDTPSDRALCTIEEALPTLRNKRGLILWGGRDFCFDRHYFDRWRKILPEAESLYLPDAGHYLLEDAQEEGIGRIIGFLGV